MTCRQSLLSIMMKSSCASSTLWTRAAFQSSSRAFVRNLATSSSSEQGSSALTKTALNELHKELGGDMVPFAGYELPVLYKGENGGVMKEHLWCRTEGKASLFDVSHMGQVSSVFWKE